MHEFSVAEAVLDLARQHVPAGAVLRSVKMIAGPMRAIDPDAMDLAWRALISDRLGREVKLTLDLPPWNLHCQDCGRDFQSPELYVACACGSQNCTPVGGDELRLVSLDVDE